MGLFGNLFGSKEKERPEIRVPTAQELLQQAYEFLQGQFPQYAQARETGLAALQEQGFAPQINIEPIDFTQFGLTSLQPATIAPVDYTQFQPTSFEQGLTTYGFQPLLEQAQRQALHIGSLAGIPSAAPAHFGRAIAPTMQNIGQLIAQLTQQRSLTEQERLMQQAGFEQQTNIQNALLAFQRAQLEQARRTQQALSTEQARQFNLGSMIGQDPLQQILQGATLGSQQSQLQAQEQLAQWQAQQGGGGGGSTLLSLLGGGLGALLAAPTGGMSIPMGAALGGAIGGTTGSLFGGGASPIGFQDALLLSQLGGGGFGGNLFGGSDTATQQMLEQIFGKGDFLTGSALGRALPVGQ